MAVYTWPAERTKFVSSRFNLAHVSLGSASSFSPAKRKSLVYQVWRGDFTYAPSLGPSTWQDFEAFVARMDGDVNVFRFSDPLRCQPKYNRQHAATSEQWSDSTNWSDGTGWLSYLIPPTAQLDAAASRGESTIKIKGLPVSIAGALSAGDLLEIRPNGVPTDTGNLYMITVGGATDANGEIGVEIRPRLRQNFAENDMVVLHNAQTVMRLADPDQAQIERAAAVGSFGFSCIEHLG